MKRIIVAALAAGGLNLAACQTPHSFAPPDATWKTHLGQLKYTAGERVLIGEATVRRHGAADFHLDFVKAGGFPLLKLQMDATTARAEGLLARGSWQGRTANAPEALRAWTHLRTAFACLDTRDPNACGSEITCEFEYRSGDLSRLKVASKERGEQFEFVFAR